MTFTDNILTTYRRATPADIAEGLSWYTRANALAVELAGEDYRQACGVIAALSPLLSWTKNEEYAKLAYTLRGYDIEEMLSYMPCLDSSARKALRIANGESPEDVLGGLKVTAFFHCIAEPLTTPFVCVDTHAMHIAEGVINPYKKSSTISKAKYTLYANAYVEAAAMVGMSPANMQAITWIAHRRIKNGR